MTATLTEARQGYTTACTPALDADLFATLWREHRGVVRAYLSARLPNAADELLSETFCRAWAARHTFRPGVGTPRGWLIAIASNVLADHWRATARRVPLVLVDRFVVDPADPCDPAAAAVERLSIAAVLATLPEHQRRVLTLRYLLDLDIPTVAEVLGIPSGTVKSATSRALRALAATVAANHRRTA